MAPTGPSAFALRCGSKDYACHPFTSGVCLNVTPRHVVYVCVGGMGGAGWGGGGGGFQTDNKQKNNNDVILLPVVSVSAFYSEH